MLSFTTPKIVLLNFSYLAIVFISSIPNTHCNFNDIYDRFSGKLGFPQVPDCSWLNSCSQCYRYGSQYCHWRSSKCIKRDNFRLPVIDSELVCPPKVQSFIPTSGPIEGGTVIIFKEVVFGRSLNSGDDVEDNKMTIMIGDRKCDSMVHNIREVNSVLACRIESSSKVLIGSANSTSGLTPGPVKVTVEVNYSKDLKFGFYIRGAVQPEMQFQFLQPEVYGIYPSYGPLDGETFVMIYGRNLNISNDLEVRINTNHKMEHPFVICRMVRRFESYAICKTPKVSFDQTISHPFSVTFSIDYWNRTLDGSGTSLMPHDGRPEEKCSGELTFKEDSSNLIDYIVDPSSDFAFKYLCEKVNQFLAGNLKLRFGKSFQYLPNPVITKLGNFSTVASGGISIRFEGQNLNSSTFPVMISYVENMPNVTMLCRPDSSGTILECPLEASKRDSAILKPFVEKLHYVLKFDGFVYASTSDLMVFPGPVFNNSVKVLAGSDRIIEFAGSYLNPNLPYSIVLTAPNDVPIPCEVIDFRIDEQQEHLWCRLDLSPEMINNYTESNLNVSISVGSVLNFRPGFARFDKLPDADKWPWLWLIILSCSGIIISFMVYLWYRRQNRFPQALEPLKWKEDLEGIFARNSSETRDFRSLFVILRDCSMLIDPSQLIVNHHLGSGNYGTVYKAFFESTNIDWEQEEADQVEVAVKVQNRDSGVFYEFIGEVQVMLEFNHPNVMYLVGVTLHENRKPAIVLPFMDGLDLKSFVISEQLKVEDLLCFGLQIANGMTYLSELNLIHRDLALRNCMIQRGTPPMVRVADFGLTRVTTQAYYQCSRNALPFLWMAPEALKRFRFSIKSDVYSYGITLWELMTRGKTPFEFFTADELIAHLEGGHRLPMPDGCPDLIYTIMGKCWMHDPDDRPVFAEIYDELDRAIERIDNLENAEAHLYENSFFARYSRNREFIFDYSLRQTRDILNQAEESILRYKIGTVFNPSRDLREEDNRSENKYQKDAKIPAEFFFSSDLG